MTATWDGYWHKVKCRSFHTSTVAYKSAQLLCDALFDDAKLVYWDDLPPRFLIYVLHPAPFSHVSI